MRSSLRLLTRSVRPAIAPTRASPSFTSSSLIHARKFATSNDSVASPTVSPFLYTGPVPLVQQRAPDFNATALIDGEFAPITMSQFKGKW